MTNGQENIGKRQVLNIERLQSYLHWSASLQRVVIEEPPFRLYVSPHDERGYFNYAIPTRDVERTPGPALAAVREQFARCGRRAAFEYLEAFAPNLGAALRREGFVETARETVMICEPSDFRPSELVAGLEVLVLDSRAPSDQLRAWIETTELGFDPDHPVVPTRSEVEDFRRRLVTARAFLALIDGQPAGAAMFTPPNDGLTEVAGVATLPEFRRRGVAGAVITRALSVAFESGVETAFLAFLDDTVARVYARRGFRPFAAKLAYGEPDIM